jgi:hypothetical protein
MDIYTHLFMDIFDKNMLHLTIFCLCRCSNFLYVTLISTIHINLFWLSPFVHIIIVIELFKMIFLFFKNEIMKMNDL